MDTTRAEFIVKMRKLIEAAEKKEYASECFMDCKITAGGFGGSVEFDLGSVKAEARLFRATLGDVQEKVIEKADEKKGNELSFNRVTENLIEIVWAFEIITKRYPEMADIDSMEWKQYFVKWANEFEAINHGREWTGQMGNDYYEAIMTFITIKALEVLKEMGDCADSKEGCDEG